MRVLLVEDDPTVMNVFCLCLKVIGVEFKEVEDGVQAVQVFQQDQRFDLVLSDFRMPGMNGLQLAEALHSISPAVRVVLISGSGGEISLDDLGSAGVERILHKPVGLDELRGLVVPQPA